MEKKEKDELESLVKELKGKLEKLDEKVDNRLEKTDEEIYQERKEEIQKDVNEIVDTSKRAIICAGEESVMMSGTGTDLLGIWMSVLGNMIHNRKYPKHLIEDCFEEVIEQSY